jgi:hypothetical protein
LCSITFFRKSCRLWENVVKCGGIREAADDNKIWCMRVACWISNTSRAPAHAYAHAPGHPRTHSRARTHTHTDIRNTYCFSAPTTVPRTRLSVTLYVHCPSPFIKGPRNVAIAQEGQPVSRSDWKRIPWNCDVLYTGQRLYIHIRRGLLHSWTERISILATSTIASQATRPQSNDMWGKQRQTFSQK